MRLLRISLIAFASVVALATAAVAADVPPGFVDVRWGASAIDIKRSFAQRPGVEVGEETPSRMVFRHGEFADYPVDHWDMEIGQKGFWRGTVYLIIPTGNAPDGVPLRNRQFDNLAASLTKKYGKPSPQPGAANAAEATWILNDPATGRKGAYTLFLHYSWAPYEFLVRYSYNPDAAKPAATPPTKGKKDL